MQQKAAEAWYVQNAKEQIPNWGSVIPAAANGDVTYTRRHSNFRKLETDRVSGEVNYTFIVGGL